MKDRQGAVGVLAHLDCGADVVAPVASVPEPENWLLMLLGFGVIGAGLRRRHKPVIS